MRCRLPLLILVCLAGACRSGATVRGSLLDEAAEEVQVVWVVGQEGRTELQEGEFDLGSLPAGTADLRFGGEEGEVGRLMIQELPRGTRLTLADIWIDPSSGLAFPSRIELRGARTVTINGLRMAPPEQLRGRLDEEAVVLALSGEGAAFLARPHDERLPDLRVVLVPATEFVTPDGDPVPEASLAVGDSIRVEGTAEQGYLFATRIVLPRRSVLREDLSLRMARATGHLHAPVEAWKREMRPRRRGGGAFPPPLDSLVQHVILVVR